MGLEYDLPYFVPFKWKCNGGAPYCSKFNIRGGMCSNVMALKYYSVAQMGFLGTLGFLEVPPGVLQDF